MTIFYQICNGRNFGDGWVNFNDNNQTLFSKKGNMTIAFIGSNYLMRMLVCSTIVYLHQTMKWFFMSL